MIGIKEKKRIADYRKPAAFDIDPTAFRLAHFPFAPLVLLVKPDVAKRS